MVRIAQVSDIHIGADPQRYYGVDVRGNFLSVMDDVLASNVDVLVLSGDLAYDVGELPAYEWVKEQLHGFHIPTVFMSGNHDSVERMSRIFGLSAFVKNEMLYFRQDLGGFPCFFLDTEPDFLAKEQIDWLESELKDLQMTPLVFMHHPPCLCNHAFMDRKYPLHNIDEVQHRFAQMPSLKHVFCGHYHFAHKQSLPTFDVYVCPATQMQISPLNKDFEVADPRPGWRLIEWDGCTLQTSVRYCPVV